MGLPFTAEQFFGVFADYNRAFIVAVVALWVASIAIVAHVARDPSGRSPRLSLFLGVLWLWNAVVYHALFFTRINPAAWLFAALFLAQAVLFFWTAARRRTEFFSSTGWTRVIGVGLIGYALLYPSEPNQGPALAPPVRMKADEHRCCCIRRHARADHETDLRRRETTASEVKRDDDSDSADSSGSKRPGDTDKRCVARQRVDPRRAHWCGVHGYSRVARVEGLRRRRARGRGPTGRGARSNER